jgi:cytochrome c oxidase subunit I+III
VNNTEVGLVYTYPAGLGWDYLNLTSTVGALIFASGVLLFLVDIALHFRRARRSAAIPGTPARWTG